MSPTATKCCLSIRHAYSSRRDPARLTGLTYALFTFLLFTHDRANPPGASVPPRFPPLGAGAGALCGPFESSGGFIFPHHLLSFYSGRDLGFETSSKPQIAPQIINKSLVTPNSQIRPVSQFNSLRRSFDREKTSRTILLVRSDASLVALRRSSARQPRAVRPLWRPHQCCRASRRCPPCTASLVRRTRASRMTPLLLFMSPALATGASATVVGVQSSVAPNISERRPNCA